MDREIIDRDFFIKLVFGTHKVADLLIQEGREGPPANEVGEAGSKLKTAANRLLADLLLICEENPVTLEQKKNVLPRTLRGIGQVQDILRLSKEESKVNPRNFTILEQEYKKIPDILVEFFVTQNFLSPTKEENGDKAVEESKEMSRTKRSLGVDNLAELRRLSPRQEKILEFLKTKEKAQVWELQKMLPEPVTKRTLRRDMDYLMQQGKVERQGEWNGVFYKLSPTKEELTR